VATGYIDSIGDPVNDDVDRRKIDPPKGTYAVWPLRPNGDEGLWGITPETAKSYHKDGFIRSRNHKPQKEQSSIHYLPSGTVRSIKDGQIEVVGRDPDGAVQGVYRERKGVIPKRVWNKAMNPNVSWIVIWQWIVRPNMPYLTTVLLR
jgi:adenine-specific DNA-methyltransferase